MHKTSKAVRRLSALAGLMALASLGSSTMLLQDAKINIDRALNSPTVTVRYSGANAALVELRLNGESVGTRAVTASKASGETNFTINLTDLKDGDNEVEIRLFDRTGKLVGSEKTKILTDQTEYGPVYLSTPKVGQTVIGSAEISVGFGREMKDVYVSFFVDNNFKKLTNFPPYTFTWDTTGETNGWHEVEAWVVDASSNTYKTRKTRIFVNNPGGRTDRQGVSTNLKTTRNPNGLGAEGTEAGMRNLNSGATSRVAGAQLSGSEPKMLNQGLRSNGVRAGLTGSPSGFKAVNGSSLATGTKAIAPAQRVVMNAPVKKAQGAAIKAVASGVGMIRITKGQRIPNLASFAVVYNSQFVDFDVNPRVDDGIPMAPFRHLLEKSGGTIDWENATKTVNAKTDGKNIFIQIGDKTAKIDSLSVTLETAPYIDRGRTIVPLSFLTDALGVTIEFDKETGHVLITSGK